LAVTGIRLNKIHRKLKSLVKGLNAIDAFNCDRTGIVVL